MVVKVYRDPLPGSALFKGFKGTVVTICILYDSGV
jgi:hypothetical protein